MKSSDNERLMNTRTLSGDLLPGDDPEFFADPERRLELIKTFSVDDWVDLTIHINGRMRGINPRYHRLDGGSKLPAMLTAHYKDKDFVLRESFGLITNYLGECLPEDPNEALHRASLAVEAAIIYTHAFRDGNGRTSRYLSGFIELGSDNVQQLEDLTVDSRSGWYRKVGPRALRHENDYEAFWDFTRDQRLDYTGIMAKFLAMDEDDKQEYLESLTDDEYETFERMNQNSVAIGTVIACLSSEEQFDDFRRGIREGTYCGRRAQKERIFPY